jgi:hypothetical protein
MGERMIFPVMGWGGDGQGVLSPSPRKYSPGLNLGVVVSFFLQASIPQGLNFGCFLLLLFFSLFVSFYLLFPLFGFFLFSCFYGFLLCFLLHFF